MPEPELPASDLELFFELFPEKDLAKDIFHIIEFGRINHIINNQYPGLKDHVVKVQDHLISKRPRISELGYDKQKIVEVLGQAILTGKVKQKIEPDLLNHAKNLVSRVKLRDNTVYATAAITSDIYEYIHTNFKDKYISVDPFTLPIYQKLVNEKIGSFSKTAKEMLDTLGSNKLEELLKRINSELGNEKDSVFEADIDSINDSQNEDQSEKDDKKNDENNQDNNDNSHSSNKSFNLTQKVKNLLKKMRGSKKDSADNKNNGSDSKNKGSSSKENSANNFDSGSDFEAAYTEQLLERFLHKLYRDHKIKPKQVKDNIRKMSPNAAIEYLMRKAPGLKNPSLNYATGILYPEWNCNTQKHQPDVVRIQEKKVSAVDGSGYGAILKNLSGIIKVVRKEFEKMRPEENKHLKRQVDGDDIDLDSCVEYFTDLKSGHSPSDKIYIQSRKYERSIATTLLMDVSGSTGSVVNVNINNLNNMISNQIKRVIDIEKEALIVLSEGLDKVRDPFSIYFFSGNCADNVEFYLVKEFEEKYDNSIRSKICSISPSHNNRDGAAIRHAATKLASRSEKIKLLVLISDSLPADAQYDSEYAVEDTRMAVLDAKKLGVKTFSITIPNGYGMRFGKEIHLPRLYGENKFISLTDIKMLPTLLPRVYQKITN